MKIDDNSLKEFISKEWDAKNEIDFLENKLFQKNVLILVMMVLNNK